MTKDTDKQLAAFATMPWVAMVAAVPTEEIPTMICEDPSVVTTLVGALRHARAETARHARRAGFYKSCALSGEVPSDETIATMDAEP
jgi:hypothetical protein